MLIRVWFESGDRRSGFRARLMTASVDARPAYATTPDQVVAAVASWLEDLVRA